MAVRAEHFLAISSDTADALFVVEATAIQINPASPGANFILANMVDCLRGCWAFMKPGMSRQGNIMKGGDALIKNLARRVILPMRLALVASAFASIR